MTRNQAAQLPTRSAFPKAAQPSFASSVAMQSSTLSASTLAANQAKNLAGSEAEQAELEQLMEDAAQKLKVCGHPVRLKLLYLIARASDSCVSELWVCVNQPQPVVSQHLAVLKEKGIVKSEVKGNRRIYSIVDPFVADLIRSLSPA